MYNVRLLPKAENDLRKIKNYIAKDNKYIAVAFIEKLLINLTKRASSFPKTAIRCKDFYYSVYKRYYIFYDIVKRDKEVVVLHIIHSAQYTAYKDFLK